MKGSLIARSEIDVALERDMLALHARYFEGVTAHQFGYDLAEKDWAVLIREEDGRLAGFSTLRVDQLRWHGESITLLSSGDTIVAPEAWHSSILSRTWIEAALHIHENAPRGPLLWLLLSSGYRTYRFLPVFWKEFHPRHDRRVPRETLELMRALARHRYGSCFDADAGVVRFPRPTILRTPLRAVPDSRRIDPHVAFFLEANPGHARGDELVCLTELTVGNLTAAGRRMVGLSRRLEHAP